MWASGVNLAHELGHYFGLSHIFRSCFVPTDEDIANTSNSCTTWFSIEASIRQQLEGNCTTCPQLTAAQLNSGFAIRNQVMDGDGIADTGLSMHEYPPPPTGSVCDAGYRIPMVVNFRSGQNFDYGFFPVRKNPMGYYNCPPDAFTAGQIAVIRGALLTGARNQLMAKTTTNWNAAFSDANGWNLEGYYSTIAFPDINAGGRADVCGRGSGGINCALSDGSGAFTGTKVWNSTFSDANGWNFKRYYLTIAYPDVDGNGRADVCGRGAGGINCAKSTGNSFTLAQVWNSSFSDANGWTEEKYYSTIGFPNVNGANGADVCGRGGSGIYCATSNGSAFAGTALWHSGFSDANGWGSPQYYKTIAYPDVDGDGKADVCGRGNAGVNCAKSNGSAFLAATLWSSAFSDANGWNAIQYYSTIRFPDLNNDGKADVCGRGSNGVYCGISNGTTFTNLQRWTSQFGDVDGWNQPQYYRTIMFGDIDGDGNADVCGRGGEGVYCAYSDGQTFGDVQRITAEMSDPKGWNIGPQYYSTLRMVKPTTAFPMRICGRAGDGIHCTQ